MGSTDTRIAYLRELRQVMAAWRMALPADDHNARAEAAQALSRVEAEIVWAEAERAASMEPPDHARPRGPALRGASARPGGRASPSVSVHAR